MRTNVKTHNTTTTTTTTNNSVDLVLERTIPTKRPPLVGEVIASFCGKRVLRGQLNGAHDRILGFLDRDCYFFFQVAS
jgi:hypothetical protein